MTQPPANPDRGLVTGFPSALLPQRQKDAVPLAEQHIADRSIMGIFLEEARPYLWPNLDSIVGLDPPTLSDGMMLRLAPCFHPIALRDEALIQSYTYDTTRKSSPELFPALSTCRGTGAVTSRFLIIMHFAIARNPFRSVMPRSCGLRTSNSIRPRSKSPWWTG